MAHASWLTKDKSSGSGNDTVAFGAASNNTGRSQRQTTVLFSAVGVDDVTVTATQLGKTEFASFDNTTPSVVKAGGTLTLTGTSNSSKLTFTKANDNIGITVPSSYSAGGVTTNNGVAITGDPGAAQEYAWSIVFTIPANTGVAPKTVQVVVTDDAGDTHTCTITLAAGDATLSVSPTSIQLDWDAYSQSGSASVTVTSNTSWTIA